MLEKPLYHQNILNQNFKVEKYFVLKDVHN